MKNKKLLMGARMTLMRLKYKNFRRSANTNEKMALDFHNIVQKKGGTRKEARRAMMASLLEAKGQKLRYKKPAYKKTTY